MNKSSDDFGLLQQWQDSIHDEALAHTCDRRIGPYPCCNVIQGDCLELMKALPDGAVEAAITDPPYGIGFKYDQHLDDKQEYAEMMSGVVVETGRITGVGGPRAFWQAMTRADSWHEWFPRGYRLLAACKGFVQFRPTAIQYSFDPVILLGTPRSEPSVYRKDWHVQTLAPFGAGRQRIDHPCPRPIEQVEYFVDAITKLADTILDPFCGSGTTLVAAKKLGRHFLGFEISPEYCAIARRRLAEIDAQPTLFDSKPEQMTL